MYSLAITSCSVKRVSFQLVTNYVLLLQSAWYAQLVDCSFYDNPGTAKLPQALLFGETMSLHTTTVSQTPVWEEVVSLLSVAT